MTARRLVIFDVDGTLVDSQAHILGAMARAFTTLGLAPPDRSRTLGIVGLSLPIAIARLAPEASAATVEALVAAYKGSFSAMRSEGLSPLYPGARQALETLRSTPDIVLGIATGKSRRGLDHVLEGHGIAGWFGTVQVADDHPSKPHPAMIAAALAETGTRPELAVMVGDTSYDMQMARAAGVGALGVTWGYHPPAALSDAGAARLIDGFGALVPELGAIWRET
jgi:phosphoglycolate phosphatase